MNKLDNLSEFSISQRNSSMMVRALICFRNFFIVFFLSFFIFSIIKGFSTSLCVTIAILMIFSFLYCIYETRKLLLKVQFNLETVQVEFYDFWIKKKLVSPKEDIELRMRQDFSYRAEMWCLNIYHRGKLIIKQKEINGWTKQKFEEMFKII